MKLPLSVREASGLLEGAGACSAGHKGTDWLDRVLAGSWCATKACREVSEAVDYWVQPPAEAPDLGQAALTEKFQGRSRFPDEQSSAGISQPRRQLCGSLRLPVRWQMPSRILWFTWARDCSWMRPVERAPAY